MPDMTTGDYAKEDAMNYLIGMTFDEVNDVFPLLIALNKQFPGSDFSVDRVLEGWQVRDWKHRPSSLAFAIAIADTPAAAILAAKKKLEDVK